MQKAVELWHMVAERFTLRRDNGPIDSLDTLEEFVVTRAAFIAQKTLYGYVKTRMGTRYPEMFRDDNMAKGLNIAKMYMYAACASDLAIYAVARALPGADIDDAARRAVAVRILRTGLERNAEQIVAPFDAEEAQTRHQQRLIGVDWAGDALTRDIFTESPEALMRWAPIAENLKKLDVEPAQNSVRFAWNNIRENLLKRLDAEAVQAHVRSAPPAQDAP